MYTLFQNENIFGAWPGTPDYQPDLGPQHIMKGAAIRADVTPEYLGVGYIIGPRVAGVIFAGGVFSWLVLMPAIYFFGSHYRNADLSGDEADRADVSQRTVVVRISGRWARARWPRRG